MTKEELEKATGPELIEQRDYCGVDGYYGDYLDIVNAEMLKRFNRIVDLEKENAELKTEKIPQLERRIASIRGAHSVDCRKLNARTEQVERLKKENAELKEKLKEKLKTIADKDLSFVAKFDALEKENAELQSKLDKAKALIDRFLDFESYAQERGCYIADDTRKQAEAFLKEVSE